MKKKPIRKIIIWLLWLLGFRYDPYMTAMDGTKYGKLPDGIIVRIDSKKRRKQRRKIAELRKFFE